MNSRFECELNENSEMNPVCVMMDHTNYGEIYSLYNFDNDFTIDQIIKIRDLLNKIIDSNVTNKDWLQTNKDLID